MKAEQMRKDNAMSYEGKGKASLIERADALFGFGGFKAPVDTPAGEAQPVVAQPVAPQPAAPQPAAPQPETARPETLRPRETAPAAPVRRAPAALVPVDRHALREANLIVPEDAVGGLAEEFRIIKRQLLLAARGGKGYAKLPYGERILVCSANPDEGKTFCAVNLALSMASEKDNRVLLVDADVAKPSVPTLLGLKSGPGLLDAIADERADAEDFIQHTDIPGLSVLPAGTPSNWDTEYLASARTEQVLDQLTSHDPSRIVIFDSPPALAASPASTLALSVGQVVLVVKADSTTDSALRETVRLLSGCEQISLVLNGTKFSATGRRFGSYYGQSVVDQGAAAPEGRG